MNLSNLRQRMDGALNTLKNEFAGLRTGRANPELLAPVMVEAYGSPTPLNQVGSVNIVDARLLSVQVWDKGLVSAVEKGIREAGLGLNPASDGTVVRVPLPELNEERRKELIKVAKKYTEESRIAIRNVRRDGMEDVKKGEFPEDEARAHNDDIQKLTDEKIAEVDKMLEEKEKDIMRV